MRLQTILLATTLFAAPALAQGPANIQPGGDASTGAGGQPTTSQQSVVPGQTDQEPKRAPGSTGDQGAAMPQANENSGTTTTYAPSKPMDNVAWPCPQKKVPTISAGTIWSGPDIAQGKEWDQDNDVASLAQKLASRRTPLQEVDPLVTEFAKSAGADKSKKLTMLFVGVLEIINSNRNSILNGIQRYAQGQERLAERMREESDKISQEQSEATAEGLGEAGKQRNRDFAWDQRIFKERRQALTYVCETPSILERRAFEIGRRIQAQL